MSVRGPAGPQRSPAAQRGRAPVGLRPGGPLLRRRHVGAARRLVAGAALPPGGRRATGPRSAPSLGVPVLVGQHGTGPWQVSAFTPGDDVPATSSGVVELDPQAIAHDLTSRDGRDAADAEIAGLIRSGRLAEADAWLTDALRQHSGPIATACLAVPADGVELGGWDEVNADLTAITRRGHDVVTAVGLDLSGYGDSETDDWWDKEPAVEVAYYTDSSFAFSTASLEEMLEASADVRRTLDGRDARRRHGVRHDHRAARGVRRPPPAPGGARADRRDRRGRGGAPRLVVAAPPVQASGREAQVDAHGLALAIPGDRR